MQAFLIAAIVSENDLFMHCGVGGSIHSSRTCTHFSRFCYTFDGHCFKKLNFFFVPTHLVKLDPISWVFQAATLLTTRASCQLSSRAIH